MRRVSTPAAPMQKISARDDEVPVDVHQPPSASAGRSASGSPALDAELGGSRGCGRRRASAIVPVPGGSAVDDARRDRPRRRRGRRAGARGRRRRRPRSSSRNEATSNGSRNFVSSSSPICAGRAEAGAARSAPSVSSAFRPEPSIAIAQLDEQREREERPRAHAAGRGRAARRSGSVRAADVGDDEDVEHHHRAGVDDDLRGGDELAPAAAGTAPPATSRWKTSASTA